MDYPVDGQVSKEHVEQGVGTLLGLPPALVLQLHKTVDAQVSVDNTELGGWTQLAVELQLHGPVGDHVSGDHVEQGGGTQLGPPPA